MRAASVLLVVGLAACATDGTDGVTAHGTVEVDEIALAPLVTARVVSVAVDRGDAVETGDTVAILSQATLPAAEAAAGARIAGAEAALRDLRAGARAAEVRRAEADLEAAEAELERAARDAERVRALAEAGAASRQQLDHAVAAAAVARGRREAVAATLRLLHEGPRPGDVREAEAVVSEARAGLAGVAATSDELVLVSPIAGRVLGRYADPGEVLAAGIPAMAIGQTARPWVRVYLSAAALAAVRIGQPAAVMLDGAPDRTFAGRVAAVSPEAEFTPRVALTEDERADLLFGVEIAISDTTGVVKPGLTATVMIDTAAAGRERVTRGSRP